VLVAVTPEPTKSSEVTAVVKETDSSKASMVGITAAAEATPLTVETKLVPVNTKVLLFTAEAVAATPSTVEVIVLTALANVFVVVGTLIVTAVPTFVAVAPPPVTLIDVAAAVNKTPSSFTINVVDALISTYNVPVQR
jgi:hypothetical protein